MQRTWYFHTPVSISSIHCVRLFFCGCICDEKLEWLIIVQTRIMPAAAQAFPNQKLQHYPPSLLVLRTSRPVTPILRRTQCYVSPQTCIRVEEGVTVQTNLVVRDLQYCKPSSVILEGTEICDEGRSHIYEVCPGCVREMGCRKKEGSDDRRGRTKAGLRSPCERWHLMGRAAHYLKDTPVDLQLRSKIEYR